MQTKNFATNHHQQNNGLRPMDTLSKEAPGLKEKNKPSINLKYDASNKGIKSLQDVDKVKGGTSWFLKSKRFQKLVDNVFLSIDTDGSGEIDKKELYAGLIMIHLRLAAYVGPAACRPATKEYVEEIFDHLDKDGSGHLSREEFGAVMAILLSQITSRIALYMVFPIVIIPLISQAIVDWFSSGMVWTRERLVSNPTGSSMISIPSCIQEVIVKTIDKIGEVVSEDALEKIPLTLISTVLGMLLLPWAVFQLDAFFNNLAVAKKNNGAQHDHHPTGKESRD